MSEEELIHNRVNVVVCDPCPMVYVGLQKSFESDTRINIACEAQDLRALKQKTDCQSLDIALVEWGMISCFDEESLECLKGIRQNSRLVLLGMRESPRERKQALELGVRGIINKRSTARQIRKALCRVADGGIWLEKEDAEALLDHVFTRPSSEYDAKQRFDLLTHREMEVVSLVCRGLRNKQIATRLFISETTVWHHLSSVFGKLRITDRVALVAFAFRCNLSFCLDEDSLPEQRARTRESRFSAGPQLLKPLRPAQPSGQQQVGCCVPKVGLA